MRIVTTISNPHVEKWLESKQAKTGKSHQDIFRDLAYNAMINEQGIDTKVPDRVWGEKN